MNWWKKKRKNDGKSDEKNGVMFIISQSEKSVSFHPVEMKTYSVIICNYCVQTAVTCCFSTFS